MQTQAAALPMISDAEFAERVRHTQVALTAAGLDAVLAFSTESEPALVRYYADYWAAFETCAVLIPARGEAQLLIGPESATYARARTRLPRIVQLADFRESSQPAYPGVALPTWSDVLRETGARRIGVAGWHAFPFPIHQALTAAGADLVEADGLCRAITLVKSPAEIACLSASARISEIGMAAVLERIRPGLSELQIVGIATEAMLSAGAESPGYSIWCASGPNTDQAISRATNRRIGTGEIIQVQIGAKVSGYSTSVARPVVLGECPPDLRRFLQCGLDAERQTIGLMADGARAADVARTVHDGIRAAGYGDRILYGPAHGCGQVECEWPFIETSSELTLRSGMTFQADLFLAAPGCGFRWEDTLVVAPGGGRQLSTPRSELLIL